jgi:hypothetical protein
MCRDLLLVCAAFTVTTAPIVGQTYERRATLIGGNSNGQQKCTVEVVVDGTADVEIRGDRGFLRNLTGQAPQWRRFECTGIVPTNPTDIQFRGIDGRGSQQLVRDPRNGGSAVVRITDPQGGAQGYTFDLTWSGGSAYPDRTSNPTIFDNGAYGNNRPYGNNGAYGNDGQRISTDEAIRVCQDNVRQQAAQRFNTSNVEFRRTIVEDNPGRRDVVGGSFVIRDSSNGGYNRQAAHQFSCTMNLTSGRVQSVQIDQQQLPGAYEQRGASNGQGGYYGDRVVDTAAARSCEQAVSDRIRRDGYQRFSFGPMNMENGWNVVGSVTADRRNASDSFNFACQMNGNSGRVRSVQVTRR